jgi:ADP-heptose:LPS heptosyltransferase
MRVLLVRLRQIGDVVFTTPAVRGVRERFPGAHITYIVEPAAAPVVAANPHIDEIIVAPRVRGLAGLGAELALIRQLRANAYDVAIDFHGGPRASILTWLSGARVRVGYEVTGRAWMYTRRVARPRALRARHSVENQADLLAGLEIPTSEATKFAVEMMVGQAEARAVHERLSSEGVGAGDGLIVLHVGAGNVFRQWPLASFAAVAAALAGRDARHRIVVTSGPSEPDAAGRVVADARAKLAPDQRHRVLGCSDFSLGELRALVDRAILYIGGDSGPMHVASTSRVPIVALYGPTLPARSAPWRSSDLPAESLEVNGLPCRPCDQRVCQPGDFRCLTWIHPPQVIEAAERALARASR